MFVISLQGDVGPAGPPGVPGSMVSVQPYPGAGTTDPYADGIVYLEESLPLQMIQGFPHSKCGKIRESQELLRYSICCVNTLDGTEGDDY